MPTIQKQYDRAFSVESTKLVSIVDRIHANILKCGRGVPRDRFEVFMSRDRHERLDSVEAVIRLDNSKKHKIERLLITSSISSDAGGVGEHEVTVDFGIAKSSYWSLKEPAKIVAISVQSDDRGWASTTLSDVEEQVERTWEFHTVPLVALAAIAVVALLVILLQCFPPLAHHSVPTWDWLQETDISLVEQMVGDGGAITADQQRNIETMQLRNAVASYHLEVSPPLAVSGRNLLFFGLPMTVILLLTLALIAGCYPRAVFVWGDEVPRAANRTQLRRVLWALIVGFAISGIVAKLFYEGLSQLMPLR